LRARREQHSGGSEPQRNAASGGWETRKYLHLEARGGEGTPTLATIAA